jgi:hypothetical protein
MAELNFCFNFPNLRFPRKAGKGGQLHKCFKRFKIPAPWYLHTVCPVCVGVAVLVSLCLSGRVRLLSVCLCLCVQSICTSVCKSFCLAVRLYVCLYVCISERLRFGTMTKKNCDSRTSCGLQLGGHLFLEKLLNCYCGNTTAERRLRVQRKIARNVCYILE